MYKDLSVLKYRQCFNKLQRKETVKRSFILKISTIKLNIIVIKLQKKISFFLQNIEHLNYSSCCCNKGQRSFSQNGGTLQHQPQEDGYTKNESWARLYYGSNTKTCGVFYNVTIWCFEK